LVNPDGRDFSGTPGNRYWRKNRKFVGDEMSEVYGVDPNRNHNYKWGEDYQTIQQGGPFSGLASSSSRPHLDTYRGPAPHSEEETKAVCRLAHDIHTAIAISYHNYSEIIIYPWGYTDEAAPMDEPRPNAHTAHQGIAMTMSVLIEDVHGVSYQTDSAPALLYAVNGDFTDWIYGVFGAPAFTVELRPHISEPNCGGSFRCFELPEAEIEDTFEENLPAALYAVLWAAQNPPRQSPIRTAAADCDP
jgi:carboxypeptidase T